MFRPTEPASVSSTTADKTVRICEIAAELLGVDVSKVSPETSLADLGADDLDLVEFVMELEEEFDVAIPDDAISIKSQGGDWLSDFDGLTMTRQGGLVKVA